MSRWTVTAGLAVLLLAAGTALFQPVTSQALIVEEFAAYFRGSLAPPDGVSSMGRQRFTVNGAALGMSFYRTAADPAAILEHYDREADRRGWKAREDLDLLGALTGATGETRGALSGRMDLKAFQKGERLMLLGVLARRAEETWFAAVETDQRLLARSPADPLDPLSFLEQEGAVRRCFVKQDASGKGILFAAVYRCQGTAGQWAGRLSRALTDAGWRCGGGPAGGSGYCLDIGKDRSQAVVTLVSDGNGAVIVSAWGNQAR